MQLVKEYGVTYITDPADFMFVERDWFSAVSAGKVRGVCLAYRTLLFKDKQGTIYAYKVGDSHPDYVSIIKCVRDRSTERLLV